MILATHTAGDLEAQYGKRYEFIIYANKGRAPFNPEMPRYDDIWKYNKVTGEKQIHQNQKPTDLLSRIIRQHTREGDLILDAFAGSCSTPVAAYRLQRDYIAFEISPTEYADVRRFVKFAFVAFRVRLYNTGICTQCCLQFRGNDVFYRVECGELQHFREPCRVCGDKRTLTINGITFACPHCNTEKTTISVAPYIVRRYRVNAIKEAALDYEWKLGDRYVHFRFYRKVGHGYADGSCIACACSMLCSCASVIASAYSG